MSDDDIPVLRDAVARRRIGPLSAAQLDDICDTVQDKLHALTNELLADGLLNVEESLRKTIGDRLRDELPELIDNVLREKLGKETD